MRFKRLFLLFSFFGLVFTLMSCEFSLYIKVAPKLTEGVVSDQSKDTQAVDVPYKKEMRPLHNLTIGHKIKGNELACYKYNNDEICYVGVKDYLKALRGYYDLKNVNFNDQENYLEITKSKDKYFRFYYNEDKMETNTDTFFSFVFEDNSYQYDLYTKTIDANYIHEGKKMVTYDLNPYGFKMYKHENDVTVPLFIVNSLANNDNLSKVLYNYEDFYFFNSYLEDEAVYSAMNRKLHNQELSDRLLEERFNEISYSLNYYYGLKDVLGIDDFKTYLKNDQEVYNLLMSKRPEAIDEAFKILLLTKFNDPHTSLGYKNYFQEVKKASDVKNRVYMEDLGIRAQTLFGTLGDLNESYFNTFNRLKLVNYENKTAFIKFDSFMVARREDLFDKDGNLDPVKAINSDTYYLFKLAFEQISKHKEIENVVFDLSCNTGGVLIAGINSLGFLTNKNIRISEGSLINDCYTYYDYAIDTDADGDFEDSDAYDNYNYYVLTSPVTFSCGNIFATVCHDMGLATLIGVQSGGGMCGVGEVNLSDGTSFTMSGPNAFCGIKSNGNDGYEKYDIEYGVPVDFELPYEKFYDLKYLDNLFNTTLKK